MSTREYRDDEFPARMPRTARHVATVEWAWAPANSREDNYFLSTNRSRSLWILWVGSHDFDTGKWEDMAYAACDKRGISAVDAAKKLLIKGWQGEVGSSPGFGPGRFHFVMSVGLISDDDLDEVADAVWGPDDAEARQQGE